MHRPVGPFSATVVTSVGDFISTVVLLYHSMHHCLLIPELAISIIRFLADDRPAWHDSRYLKNPGDVARLAQTCKALAEPALDILWKTQHSLAPLVMCLPPDVWELTRRGKTIALKREPTPMEWSSLTKYAHRIWFISQPASFNLPRLDDVVLAALISPSHFGALFPSLRILDYSVVSVAAPMVHLLTKVLSTERHLGLMTSLCVICPRASQREQVYDLFQAIRTKATQLETLRIDSFTSTASNSTLAVTLMEGEFKFLRKLELSWTIHISSECLTCLVGMEHLQEISLCVRRDIGLDFLVNGCSFTKTKDLTSPTCKRTLPVLKSLKVMAHSLDQCTALVSLVTSPFLDNITFSYDVQAPSVLIEAFFRQVHETCQNAITISTPAALSPPHTISLTLKHNLGPLSSATSPFLIHPSETLYPLLTLRHLRSLRLLHLGTIAVDDGFLREAANAWGAHLQELEECGIPWVGVEESSDLPGYVAATLDGVGEFMRRCPRLERLRVAFDGRGMPSPEERPGETQSKQERAQEEEVCDCDPSRESERLAFSSSVLQVLNVRDSPIDDPERVAKFLKRVAPALRVICVEGSLDMWRKWREVEDRMK